MARPTPPTQPANNSTTCHNPPRLPSPACGGGGGGGGSLPFGRPSPGTTMSASSITLPWLERLACMDERWYEVRVERGVTMTASDGTTLVMDIYRPAQDGQPITEPVPTLVERTPYDRAGNRLVL